MVARRVVLLLLSTTLLAATVTAASAAAAPFEDRVVDSPATSRLKARAAQASDTIAVPIAGGATVRVRFTRGAGGVQPELAQSYVAYLDSLPHGSELQRLSMVIAAPSEIPELCGAPEDDGIVACYGALQEEMVVESSGLDAGSSGYTVRYVLAHEYGHHIAANRSNNEFPGGALDYGPKYWASYELVCDQALQGRLHPGDEGRNYLDNPGEAWAEAYARLVFPEQPWEFSPLLVPDAGALDAARRDVLEPWMANRSQTFAMAAGRNRQAFAVPLTLDGLVAVKVRGPKGSEVGVRITSGSQRVGSTRQRGRRDAWRLAAGCREAPVETLTFTAMREGGASGPVTLKVSYPG